MTPVLDTLTIHFIIFTSAQLDIYGVIDSAKKIIQIQVKNLIFTLELIIKESVVSVTLTVL